MLHFETAVFRRFTQRAIDERDEDTVVRCFAVADKYFAAGNGKLENAIGVSYIEDLLFTDQQKSRQWAWTLFPARLKAAFGSLHAEHVAAYDNQASRRY